MRKIRKTKASKKNSIGVGCISPNALDQVVNLIVTYNYSLKRIAFEMGVTYALLLRRINADPSAKALIDDAREVAVFETGLKMIELADNADKDNMLLTQLKINTRRDAALLSMKMRDTVSKGKADKKTQVINVGVVVVPAKQQSMHESGSPRLVVDNSRVIDQK